MKASYHNFIGIILFFLIRHKKIMEYPSKISGVLESLKDSLKEWSYHLLLCWVSDLSPSLKRGRLS